MEENNKKLEQEIMVEPEEKSSFDFQAIFRTLVLNWKWFVLSLIIALGLAAIYLRYTTPMYQAFAKFLIKHDSGRGGSSVFRTSNFGTMATTEGIDNEMEILKSRSLAAEAIRDLKLYVTYTTQGRVTDRILYKDQPITVDLDAAHLERLNAPISLQIERENKKYKVTGTYYVPNGDSGSTGPYSINKTFDKLPASINTRAGLISLNTNPNGGTLAEGTLLKVGITSPRLASFKYAGALSVGQTSKSTSIAQLSIVDQVPQRAIDYLKQLPVVYNRQANEDKNTVARRTEEFINQRIEKINAELGSTEGAIEAFKKQNRMVNQASAAGMAASNADAFEKQLAEANTQVALMNSITDYMDQASNKYQTLPSNVGLSDATTSSLINKYNEIALERNRLLRSASESSPTVAPLTAQLDDISASIKRAMTQNRRNMDIKRSSIASQYGKYTGQIFQSPEQERVLNQIGRQQEVKSGLYLMLLQKREENSISLAATADKGKMIDEPTFAGRVSPKSSMIYLIATLLGLGIPALILFLIQFFRYKIEGHEDVVRLTRLPLLADVAVASETAKTKADIVVHENKNNQMEEIFRSMRTNLQFMLTEGQKVILFTSTTSGEGKTFNAANLAVSFALLGKKTVLVGLDIRKPRLASLFEIDNKKIGITNLLTKEQPTESEVKSQILNSGINDNLDLLLAGPTPPNPTELIARQSLDTIFEILRKDYDYILIDSAPVGLVTDTLQIGRVADATVYMCRADYTPKASFELINGLAQEKKLPNMSIVLNGIDMSKKKYGYYYGYGRYGKYGRYGRYSGKYGYGKYGRYGTYGAYGSYGQYGSYGSYGHYSNSHYGDKNDTSIKLK